MILAFALLPALDAASPANDPFTAQQRGYWAFQPVVRPALPEATSPGARTAIDAFITEKLRAKGLTLAPVADKVTLIRRATFDLIGLPPAPAEVEAFLADNSPEAFERVIERLLASPHYGERWGRHWLDLARYAESEGFKSDETRPNAWRYRDYVIQAFNDDKPYDRFVREQIAGDELWPNDPQARIATAFNRHYPDESNAKNLMQRRQEILHDVTDTAGLVFLGLTIGCAKCHDHKFDPILQKDYYRLQAFFANVGQDDAIQILPPDRVESHEAQLAEWEQKTKAIRDEMAALLEPQRKAWFDDLFAKYPELIQNAFNKPEDQRTPYETLMAWKVKPYLNPDPQLFVAKLAEQAKQRYDQLQAELQQFADLHPGELPLGIGIIDLGRQAPFTHVLKVGVYDAPQEEVEPGFLSILDPSPATIAAPAGLPSSGRRTALANWLASPRNPLTARVMANRVWHYHFGKGIVGTPSDFGQMGDRPTHPELLDWLAAEFVDSGWSIKQLHRLIMTSHAYRQSSADRPAGAADPMNRLLWRFPPQRLEAEVIRDSMLAVAGLLDTTLGGPSVFPALPPGMPEPRGGWQVSADPADHHRRSIYIFVRRNARYPMLESFDMPDTHESCARRNVTMTAPQALALLNSEQSLAWAQSFAGRALAAAGDDPVARVEEAYRLAYSRSPDGWEKDQALTFFNTQSTLIAERQAAGEKLALPTTVPEGMEAAEAAAVVDFCHALLNANEFVFRY